MTQPAVVQQNTGAIRLLSQNYQQQNQGNSRNPTHQGLPNQSLSMHVINNENQFGKEKPKEKTYG